MKFLKVVFFVMLLGMLCGSAQAALDGQTLYGRYDPTGWNNNGSIIVYGEGYITIPGLYSHIWNNTANAWDISDTIIRKDSDYEYTIVKGDIVCITSGDDNGFGQVNASDTTLNFGENGAFANVRLKMNNCTLTGSTNYYPNMYNTWSNGDINNVTTTGFRKFYFNRIYKNDVVAHQFNMSNVNASYGFDGIILSYDDTYYIENSTFENISTIGNGNLSGAPWNGDANDRGGGHLSLSGNLNNNITIRNFYGERTLPFSDDPEGSCEGGTGIELSGGQDFLVENVTLIGSARSGFDLTGDIHNTTVRNIYSSRALHNSVDYHGQWNITTYNITAEQAEDEGFMITGRATAVPGIFNDSSRNTASDSTTCSHDLYFYGVRVINNAAQAFSVNSYHSVYFENVTVDNCTSLGSFNRGKNLTFVNLSVTNISNVYSVNLGATDLAIGDIARLNDTKFIDSKFPANHDAWLVWSYNTSFINTNVSGLSVLYDDALEMTSNGTVYYYPNIIVKNTTGSPVSNAIITVNTTTKNGLGETQSSYRTDANGKLYDSANRTNWLAIPDYEAYNTGTKTFVSEITATKTGQTNSTVLDPDASYYSPNPSDLQGPETILTLNVAGEETEPETILPTASFDGNVTSGEAPLTVAFTDNSTGTPTAWSWNFGDTGTSDIQNPVHTYAVAGTYDVTLAATNVNGSDTLTMNDYITATFSGSDPVANFTGTPTNGTVRLSVQFNDTSENNATSWAWDFDNNSIIDSTVQNPVYKYKTAGNYTVNLTVSNAGGTDTEIKTNYIVAEKTNYLIYIWNWFSNIFFAGGLMYD